jgi:hypothetical protein
MEVAAPVLILLGVFSCIAVHRSPVPVSEAGGSCGSSRP